MDASGVQNGMPTCTIGHRLCLEWGWLCLDLCTRMDWNRALSCLVMRCHALLLIRDLSDLKSKMTGWHDDVWSSYDHVWWCVMLCDVPFKSKDSSLDLWRYGAWGEGGVQHGKLRRVTQHLDRLRRCLRFRFCQGVRLRVGESKVTWKKDLNTKFDSHHTSTHVITSTHIDTHRQRWNLSVYTIPKSQNMREARKKTNLNNICVKQEM